MKDKVWLIFLKTNYVKLQLVQGYLSESLLAIEKTSLNLVSKLEQLIVLVLHFQLITIEIIEFMMVKYSRLLLHQFFLTLSFRIYKLIRNFYPPSIAKAMLNTDTEKKSDIPVVYYT